MSKLRKYFELPAEAERIKKYKCVLGGSPGHLHITTSHLCFLGGSGNKVQIANASVTEIAKAKKWKFSPGKGHSILISTSDGEVRKFNGFPSRDEAYGLIGEYAKAATKK